MGNPWIEHLKKVRKANPNLLVPEIAKLAKKSYVRVTQPGSSTKVRKSRKAKKSRKVKKSRKAKKSKKSKKAKKSRKSRKSRK